jgi:hypothetical protein
MNVEWRRRCLFSLHKKTLAANSAFFALAAIMGIGLWFARPLVAGAWELAAIMALSATMYLSSAIFCDRLIRK